MLSPRAVVGMYNCGKSKKKKVKEGSGGQGVKDSDNNNTFDIKVEGETRDPASIVSCLPCCTKMFYARPRVINPEVGILLIV